MAVRKHFGRGLVAGVALLGIGVTGLVAPLAVSAQQAAAQSTSAQSATADKSEVTFTRDIAPILQRSCQNCHRPGQVAPMSLLTYEDARPWARSMKARTAIRDKQAPCRRGTSRRTSASSITRTIRRSAMKRSRRSRSGPTAGAPRGNMADMPAARTFPDGASWHAGEPDLIVESPEILVKANTPDWWGEFPPTKLPITEDRYVKSVEIREVNNFSSESGRQTVGQRYVWHHLIWATAPVDESRRSARCLRDRRQRSAGRCTKSAATPTSSTRTPAAS